MCLAARHPKAPTSPSSARTNTHTHLHEPQHTYPTIQTARKHTHSPLPTLKQGRRGEKRAGKIENVQLVTRSFIGRGRRREEAGGGLSTFTHAFKLSCFSVILCSVASPDLCVWKLRTLSNTRERETTPGSLQEARGKAKSECVCQWWCGAVVGRSCGKWRSRAFSKLSCGCSFTSLTCISYLCAER